MLLNELMPTGKKKGETVQASKSPGEEEVPLAERTVNLGVPGDVHAAFKAFCEKRSASQRGLAGKILSWYMAQPDIVMTAVLRTDKGVEEAYAKALEELARQVRAQSAASELAMYTGEMGVKKQAASKERDGDKAGKS